MCTVSFVGKNSKLIITSNRDEHLSRPSSLMPSEEIINNCKIMFPKDPRAGGTWFAVNEFGSVAVLLNGAIKKHTPTGNYARSRGLVLLSIISNRHPDSYLNNIDLKNIEPFTLILYVRNKLTEFRWDGNLKRARELSLNGHYIWSSATLYSSEVINSREHSFNEFMKNAKEIGAEEIFDFHSENNGDYENGFIINRDSKLKTFSITQAVIHDDEILLTHHDLLTGNSYTISNISNQSSPISHEPI